MIDLSSLPGSRRWRSVLRWRWRLPEFNKDAADTDARAVEDDTEESLIAIPPVKAFVRAFETAGLWTQVVHCAWQPWFAAARAFTQTWAFESPPPSDGASRSAE